MNVRVKKTLLFFVSTSVLAVVVLLLFLPLAPGGIFGALIGLLLQLVFVMLGAVTTILMGSVFPPPLVFEVVLALGLAAIAAFIVSVRMRALKLGYAAIVVWVSVGCWSTFWGIAYGV